MINALIGFTIIGIMFAMGLELTTKDFVRVVEMPRAVVVGLSAQIILLPVLAFGLAWALDATPAIAAGMVILAACPGGPPSNVLSYLAGAHIALSITLTALSSLVTVITVPLVVNLGLAAFYDGTADVRLPVGRTLAQLAAISILPIAAGIYVRARHTERVERMQVKIKRTALTVFCLTAIVIVYDTWEQFELHFAAATVASVTLCWGTLAMGYTTAGIAGLDRRDRFTIALEAGVQNIALASLIILTQLDRPELIALPSAYAVVSLPSAMLLAAVYAGSRKRKCSS